MKLKIVLSVIAFTAVCTSVTSQITFDEKTIKEPANISKSVAVDKAMMECIYEYNDEEKETAYYEILQIGKSRSKYFSYSTYKVDSVVYLHDIAKMTKGDYLSIHNKYSFRIPLQNKGIILKNHPDKQITVYARVFLDNYEYQDSAGIDWKLSDDTVSVCGYLCRKAETDFRGRHWVAYYTESIPISDGPWKLSGLPGLILQAEDADGKHYFSAVSIRKSTDDIYITENNNRFKTNRERFNKTFKTYMDNPSGAMAGNPAAPINTKTGKPSKINPKKYDPFELE